MADHALVLGVDLDAVCGDYEGAFRDSVVRHDGRDPADLPPQTVMDAFSEWGLTFEQFQDAHRRAVLEDRIFRTMEPLPGVSDALWQLSDEGVWIRIITHRLIFNGAHETSAADTAWWLDHHAIPYRDLCFIGDKPNVGADLYVDDSPRNILKLREAGNSALVFDQPYNRDLPGPRVHDWGEIAAYVLGLLEGRRAQLPLPLDGPDDDLPSDHFTVPSDGTTPDGAAAPDRPTPDRATPDRATPEADA